MPNEYYCGFTDLMLPTHVRPPEDHRVLPDADSLVELLRDYSTKPRRIVVLTSQGRTKLFVGLGEGTAQVQGDFGAVTVHLDETIPRRQSPGWTARANRITADGDALFACEDDAYLHAANELIPLDELVGITKFILENDSLPDTHDWYAENIGRYDLVVHTTSHQEVIDASGSLRSAIEMLLREFPDAAEGMSNSEGDLQEEPNELPF